MIIYGYFIYILMAAILWVFWRKVRGRTFEELLQLRALEHHQIIELHRKHPFGGTWTEFNYWLEVERSNTKPGPRH